MMLVYLLLLPFIAGVLGLLLSRMNRLLARAVMAVVLAGAGAIVAALVWGNAGSLTAPVTGPTGLSYVVQINLPWISQLGVGFHLGADGLTLVFLGLTVILGLVAVLASGGDAATNDGLYLFYIGLVITGVTGVFLAADLILFFLFWELMVVPMYFIISTWGATERRQKAAIRFFLFTQASGLLMLVSMIWLATAHAAATGTYTFDLTILSRWAIAGSGAGGALVLAFVGFVLAFGVKLAMVPVHAWAPDAYAEAPTAGSILLSGLMLKTGGYGLLRFATSLFPQEVRALSPLFLILGVVTILYASILAIRQNDLKRIIAYSSIGHMGFVMLGLFSWNSLGYAGAIIIMLSHGFTTSALFLISGSIEARLGTRDISRMGGMRAVAPRLAGFGTAFWIFALGLPGSGNFLGEFLVLSGAFQTNIVIAVLGAAGAIFSLVYALRAIFRVFDGPREVPENVRDFGVRESIITSVLVALVLWVGLLPGSILSVATKGAPLPVAGPKTSIGQSGQAVHNHHDSLSDSSVLAAFRETHNG